MSIGSISGANPVEYSTIQNKELSQQNQTTGAGITAQSGAAPAPSSQSYQIIASSLAEFFPALSGEQIDIKIAEAMLRQQEIVGKTNTNELNAKEEQKRESLNERTNNLQEAERKMEEAEAKQKKSGFFDKIKVALQTLGALVTIGIGAALVATGVGGAAGAALIGLGAMQLLMVIDGIIAENNDGMGIGGFLAGGIAQGLEQLGAIDENQVEKAKEIGNITFQAVITIAIIAGAVMTMRADMAGAQLAQGAAILTTSMTTLTTSGLGMATSVNNRNAANAQADAQELQADSQDLQASNEFLNDLIDQILNHISGVNTQFNAMLDDISKSIKDRGDTLARANFTA